MTNRIHLFACLSVEGRLNNESPACGAFLTLKRISKAHPLTTDVPEWINRPNPKMEFTSTKRLLKRLQKEDEVPINLLGTARLNTRLLKEERVSFLHLLWTTSFMDTAESDSLVAPFTPRKGYRLTFELTRSQRLSEGLYLVYRAR